MLRFVTRIATGLILAICIPAARGGTVGTTQSAAPIVSGLFPAANAADVCLDAPLRLRFDAPPAVGEGKITILDASNNSVVQTVDVSVTVATQAIGGLPNFKYYPVICSGNDVTISLQKGSLAYNKTYYVSIDAGALKTEKGAFPGIGNTTDWRFTTKAAPPPATRTKLTVAADGSGDFCTIQGAIDFVPDGNTARTTLFVRKGTYTELIFCSNKHALTFTGEDRKQCVIAYANNALFNPASDRNIYHRGVFLAAGCNDLVISNLTIRNTTPRGGSQAEARILKGNATSRAIIANVDLYSFQDTLQINGQAYISHCYIEGDVDFMWGEGPCFFESSHCRGTRSKAYFTQVRNSSANHGFVYHQCTFDGPEGVTGMYLSRIELGRFPHSEVVLMDCMLGPAVSPAGWLLNQAKPGTPPPTTAPALRFWEYRSHDAMGNRIDISERHNISRQLKPPEDAKLIANYSKPGFVLGNDWDAASDPNLPSTAGAGQ